MPRSHLVALIVRLAIGLVILGLIGFFLYTRLRPVGTKVAQNPTPTPTVTLAPTDAPVLVYSPNQTEPTATPSPSLPTIADNNHGYTSPVRTTVSTRQPSSFTYKSSHGGDQVTSTSSTGPTYAQADSGSSSAMASASSSDGASTSSASAGPGYAYASASSSSD